MASASSISRMLTNTLCSFSISAAGSSALLDGIRASTYGNLRPVCDGLHGRAPPQWRSPAAHFLVPERARHRTMNGGRFREPPARPSFGPHGDPVDFHVRQLRTGTSSTRASMVANSECARSTALSSRAISVRATSGFNCETVWMMVSIDDWNCRIPYGPLLSVRRTSGRTPSNLRLQHLQSLFTFGGYQHFSPGCEVVTHDVGNRVRLPGAWRPSHRDSI